MATATAPIGATTFAVIGRADTTGSSTATLCSLNLQAQERAALVEAMAFGDEGEVFQASGIVAIDPETGEARLTGTAGLAVTTGDNNRLDFTVTGQGGTTAWRGHLRVDFVYDYEV